MPRLRIILYRSWLALSSLLLALFIALAIRSTLTWDRLEFDRVRQLDPSCWRLIHWRIDCNFGRLDITCLNFVDSRPFWLASLQAAGGAPPTSTFTWRTRPGLHAMPTASRALRILGLWHESSDKPGRFYRRIIFPLWLPAILFSIAPLRALLALRRRRKLSRLGLDLCPQCGYDLRASPIRCPECGRARPAPHQ